jgi:NADH dehydrogenase
MSQLMVSAAALHLRRRAPGTACARACGTRPDAAFATAGKADLCAGSGTDQPQTSVCAWLGVDADHVGRVQVEPDLSLAGDPNGFVIGDTATGPWTDGKDMPGIAPAAKQESAYVAAVLLRRLDGKLAPPAFRYSHQGDLATIGRKSTVLSFGRVRLSGWLAWLLWGAVHIFFVIGSRNRAMVALNWLWTYWTHERRAELITGGGRPRGAVEHGSDA